MNYLPEHWDVVRVHSREPISLWPPPGPPEKPTLIIGDERLIPFIRLLFTAYPEIVLWTHVLLEVRTVAEAASTFERLLLPRATLIQRQAGDGHLEHLESVARSHASLNVGARYVLSARTAIVRGIGAALRLQKVQCRNIRVCPVELVESYRRYQCRMERPLNLHA